ncbi:ras-related protein Rab-32 isoform X1 [Photinus pyralis]|nr:ras-related protein Rab-32 isoform X1 [Photinus pyralis]
MKASCEHEEDGSVDNDINGVSSGEQITTNESKRSNFDKLKRRYSFSEKFKFGKSSSSFNLTDTKQSPLIRCGSSSFPNILLVGPYDILNDSKSESDVTLEETSWKTAESSEKESSDSRSCKSVISVESTRYTLSVDKFSTPIFVERTESVEDMQKMPAYGDLILDASSTTSNLNQSGVKPKDHLYKILVIGDLGTGKTSIIKRYVHQFFSQHYRATIGVDFALKVLNWDANTLIRLQLWDIAGQERYGNMTRVYYKEAVGAFIVFDVTRVNTFESVSNWKADLDSKVQLPDGSPIPCVLLANKCDQQKEGLINSKSKMEEYCKEKGFSSWYETSAKENINIDEAARTLVSQILLNDKLINDSNKDGDQFSLAHTNDVKKKSCNC